jgi:hypothetical protein
MPPPYVRLTNTEREHRHSPHIKQTTSAGYRCYACSPVIHRSRACSLTGKSVTRLLVSTVSSSDIRPQNWHPLAALERTPARVNTRGEGGNRQRSTADWRRQLTGQRSPGSSPTHCLSTAAQSRLTTQANQRTHTHTHTHTHCRLHERTLAALLLLETATMLNY